MTFPFNTRMLTDSVASSSPRPTECHILSTTQMTVLGAPLFRHKNTHTQSVQQNPLILVFMPLQGHSSPSEMQTGAPGHAGMQIELNRPGLLHHHDCTLVYICLVLRSHSPIQVPIPSESLPGLPPPPSDLSCFFALALPLTLSGTLSGLLTSE